MAKKTIGKLYTSGAKGYWYVRYQVEGKDIRTRLLDVSGKPITFKKEAQAAADRLLAHIHETNKVEQLRTLKNNIQDAETAAAEAAAMLLNSNATIINGWRLFMECPKRPASCKRFQFNTVPSHTTASNYQNYYTRFKNWIIETYPETRLLSDVTPEIATAFMDNINCSSSPGTFNKYLQFFNCFFDTLSKSGKITTTNPFIDIDRAKPEYNSKKPLTIEQIAKLISEANGDLKLLFALGYFTGLRLGDCCTLLWREVDLLRQVIERIPRKTAHTVKDKSQAAVKIGIAPFLLDLLKEISLDNRNGFVLPVFAEKYLAGGEQQITKKVMKHFITCGIETHRPGTGIKTIIDKKSGKEKKTGCRAIVEIGFHSLRYSYISHNAEAGTPQAIIQRNAGHSNPAMTEHYTKISDTAAVKYASALQLPGETIEVLSEPERDIFRALADTLPIETIKQILNQIQAR